jgi:quercetin 2,3-dioxygenase
MRTRNHPELGGRHPNSMMTTNPVLTKRAAADRGRADIGWLHSHHTFSFANYFDARHMGYRTLRVINDDVVAPGMGFGTHGHRDMEIFSYVLEGELAHKDSMGNGSTIQPGGLQYMSAGRGVRHSEFNGSKEKPVHFLQIWITPDEDGAEPRYGEKTAEQIDARMGALTPLLSGDVAADAGAVPIRQDARVFLGKLAPAESVGFSHDPSRGAWVQVIRGAVTVLGETLRAGDGASIDDAAALAFTAGAGEEAEFLLFSLR